MLDKRRRAVVGIAVAAVVLTGAGLGATAFVKSPQQVAAEAGPPPPDVLTAEVERRVLTDTVVTRGRVEAARTVRVTPAIEPGEGAAAAVVTRVPADPGRAVEPGEAVLEVSGRPVFVLEGELPVYRDLGPGAEGDDVAQLQRALAQVGHPADGDPEGSYGPGTGRAVAAFYADLGYAPPRGTQGADAVMPAAELVMLPGFPARVTGLAARVGDPVTDGMLTLSAGDLVVQGRLAAHEHGLVRPGQTVRLLSETTGADATGTVASVADEPAAPGGGPAQDAQSPQGGEPEAGGYPFVVEFDEELPGTLAGRDVRLTIEAAGSEGEVLVVPVSAVSAGADLVTTVTVLAPGGERRRVEVRTGVSGDGYLEVTPVGAAELDAGDRVIVGVRQQPGEQGEAEAP